MQNNSILVVSENDYRIVSDMVNAYGSELSPLELTCKLRFLIGNEHIRPGHYMALGYLIGRHATTEKLRRKNQNSLKLCQRQN